MMGAARNYYTVPPPPPNAGIWQLPPYRAAIPRDRTAMNPPRWTEITPSEYAWEREALDYLKAHLPDGEPFRAWSNFEFINHVFVADGDTFIRAAASGLANSSAIPSPGSGECGVSPCAATDRETHLWSHPI